MSDLNKIRSEKVRKRQIGSLFLWVALFSFNTLADGQDAMPPAPVKGFADYHLHLFSEDAWGGGWLHGTVSGSEAVALKSCDGGKDHAQTIIPIASSYIGHMLNANGDTGNHLNRTEGYPDYKGWPSWDAIAHQQAWSGWVKEAHDRGLSLVVVSATDFTPLCKLIPKENLKYDCGEMASVDRQIEDANRFVKANKWAEIAKNPNEAREIIQSGKLAIVLSLEVDRLFENENWKTALDRYYSKGIRTLQIVHELNNRFSGAATHNGMFKVFQWIEDFKSLRGISEFFSKKIGFDTDELGNNKLGLTQEGRGLVTEMMNRGMPIDLSHMPEKTVREIDQLSESRANYPLYVSHGHIRAMMDDGHFDHWEHSNPDWLLDLVVRSEGVYGLRTAPEKTKEFQGTVVPNDCQGSSKSFAQTYQYGVIIKKLKVGFGSDMNGFIQQTRPRFGGDASSACGGEPGHELRHRQQLAQKSDRKQAIPFDQSGLGRYSQLPDLLDELKSFGVNTASLEISSESFIRMWEKATKISKQKAALNLTQAR